MLIMCDAMLSDIVTVLCVCGGSPVFPDLQHVILTVQLALEILRLNVTPAMMATFTIVLLTRAQVMKLY